MIPSSTTMCMIEFGITTVSHRVFSRRSRFRGLIVRCLHSVSVAAAVVLVCTAVILFVIQHY